MTRLWVRAEASATIGLGHLMRMVALAEAARSEHIAATFVLQGDERGTVAATARDFEVLVVQDASWLSGVERSDLVMFDGYSYGRAHFEAAVLRGATVGAMDDLRRRPLGPALLVCPEGEDTSTRLAEGQLQLGGFQYALIRPEFGLRRRRRAGPLSTILIALGGGDHTQAIPSLVAAAEKSLPDLGRCVVLCSALAGDLTQLPPSVDVVVSPPDVAAVFDDADLVVTGGGTTACELACMGIPTALVEVAPDQRQTIAWLVLRGAGVAVGPLSSAGSRLPECLRHLGAPDVLRRASLAGLESIDGHGAARVLAALLSVGSR